MHRHPLVRYVLCSIAACALATASGCDQGPRLAPVQGVVKVNGAPPPGVGYLAFAPLEVAEGSILRPGQASFGLDGKFSATSFGTDEGLPPGKYRVSIVCWKEQPSGKNLDGVSYVPPDYRPEELVVDEDGVDVTYDIPLGPKK